MSTVLSLVLIDSVLYKVFVSFVKELFLDYVIRNEINVMNVNPTTNGEC